MFDFLDSIPIVGDVANWVGDAFSDVSNILFDDPDLEAFGGYGEANTGVGSFLQEAGSFLGDIFSPSSPGGRQTSAQTQALAQLGISNRKALARVERLSRKRAMQTASENLRRDIATLPVTKAKDTRSKYKDGVTRAYVKALNGINGKAGEQTAIHGYKQMVANNKVNTNVYAGSVETDASTLKELLEQQQGA